MPTAVLRFTTVPVTSVYGWRVLSVSGLRNHHDGTDTGNGTKYPHSAFGDGIVVESPQKVKHWKYGWYIRIEHADGIETSHHSFDGPALFKEGQTVHMGEIIGYAGESALSANGNHVHNALWLGGKHVDPLLYLTPGVAVVVSTETTAGNGATPFPQEEDDMYTQEDRDTQNNIHAALWKGGEVVIDGVTQTFNYGVLPIVVHNQKLIAQLKGQVAGLSAAVSAISGGTPINLTAVEAAAEKGAREALAGITFKAEVS